MSLPPPPPSDRQAAELTCYRHADRVAGRRCTRCGKPACGDCLVAASVGSHCLDCVKAAQPSTATRLRIASARQPVLVTFTLIAINVAVFLVTTLFDPATLGGGSTGRVHINFALAEEFLVFADEWYRLVTSGFLHFGIIHLAFNMYMLYLLGQMLEPTLGRVRFALLYFASLLGGSLGVIVLQDVFSGLTAGASGAVFGMLAAAAIGQYQHGLNPLSTAIGRVLLLNVLFTFLGPGISIGGHLGGLMAGAICGAIMLAPQHRGFPSWAAYATPVAVGLISLVGAFVLASGSV